MGPSPGADVVTEEGGILLVMQSHHEQPLRVLQPIIFVGVEHQAEQAHTRTFTHAHTRTSISICGERGSEGERGRRAQSPEQADGHADDVDDDREDRDAEHHLRYSEYSHA